ncbi:CAP domain-containing protein [Marinospirillum perlucidum]|uniref:CAP domain-containing protein n=1 Tax=Marinospirillum perlucidum TaxID=1982602 RepID=UPI000DF41593|nr:CAP domain-containing protein [Marinospirillum perlucidum]
MPQTRYFALPLLASVLLLLGGCLDSDDSSQSGSTASTDTTSDSTSDSDTSDSSSKTTEGAVAPLTEQEINDFIQVINNYRSQGADCGSEGVFGSQPALSSDQRLADAAQVHSNDQYKYQRLTHTGSDGSNAGERMQAQGYSWSAWGENVARGYTTVEAVAKGWMDSDGHCKNMMSSNFTELGIAASGENSLRFWTLKLAKPKN